VEKTGARKPVGEKTGEKTGVKSFFANAGAKK